MTPQQTIETLKLMQSEVEWEYTMDYTSAIDKSIKILKRHIPQKIKYEFLKYNTYTCKNEYACRCPSCGTYIITFSDKEVNRGYNNNDDDIEKMFHNSMVHHAYMGLNNFCNCCGQKLKWR
jgi:hypothetical protein